MAGIFALLTGDLVSQQDLNQRLALLRQEVLRAQEKQTQLLVEEAERRIIKRLGEFPFAQITLSDGAQITLEAIVRQVLAQLQPVIQSHLEEIIGKLDIDGLGDQAYQSLDMDDLIEVLAKQIGSQVMNDLDRSALLQVLAQLLMEDYLDADSIAEQVSDAVSERLQISLSK